MTVRIHKHALDSPVGKIKTCGPVLSAGATDDGLVVWAIDDSRKPPATRKYMCVNTGYDFELDYTQMRFIGTVTTSGGTVWHVFVEKADG